MEVIVITMDEDTVAVLVIFNDDGDVNDGHGLDTM